METNLATPETPETMTTSTVTPCDLGDSQVTISTAGITRHGRLLDWLERFLKERFLQHVYTEEIKLPAAVAEKRHRAANADDATHL